MTKLLTVDQVAQLLNVSRQFVYDHAEELSAMRLSDAPNGPLRFDQRRVQVFLSARRLVAA